MLNIMKKMCVSGMGAIVEVEKYSGTK